jgi:hexosaminidase
MTRRQLWIALAGLALASVGPALAAERESRALLPVPAAIEWRDGGRLVVGEGFSVAVQGPADARLDAAVRRMLERLAGRTAFELPPARRVPPEAATLVVSVRQAGPGLPALGDDESYTLEVGERQAVLEAPLAVGALRGLETFLQLLEGDSHGWSLPASRVQDRPRFPWRGLLLDVCRHWIPPDVARRQIDAMAAVKLNVLHLHLTEDQGFRIESRRYPKLHERGSDGLYYTQAQIRDLVAYAAARGIRVVPEFDMPGHVTSWLVGHPELGSAPGPYAIERKWGIFDPAFDPTREETYAFLDRFLGEMAGLFPDAYMHIGGDENNGKQWNANPAIRAFMQKRGIADAHALQAYFNGRLARILAKHGKRMMGWDEILHEDLPKGTLVHSWRGPRYLAEAARRGHPGILSWGYYLDLMHSTARHYAVDPLPPDSGLTPEQAKRVLGGEACMWAEWVSPETIDSRIWPRLAAIAERLWSPPEVRDVRDLRRRMGVASVRLEELELTHETGPGAMLRRLAGTRDTGALETLAALLEPVEDYHRGRLFKATRERPGTQQLPLTRLVDAVRPESEVALRLEDAVADLLDSAPRLTASREQLRATFAAWREARPGLEWLIDASPTLHEARPFAADLERLATIGLDALAWLASSRQAPEAWRAEALQGIEEASRPKGELELAVIPSLRQLVVAAAASHRARGEGAEGFRAWVIEEARPPAPGRR